MRIVIDMQGAQTASRYRGIGRYSLAFAQGVVRNRGEHEIILALNGMFPETIDQIRAAFAGQLPQTNIRVWHAVGPVSDSSPENEAQREAAEFLREAFLESLQPDLIHISSFFEGFLDDAVTSIGKINLQTPVSVMLYDLIPLVNPDQYLNANPLYSQHYHRKLNNFKQATLFLSISDFSRQEGISQLGLAESIVVNISAAIDHDFHLHASNKISESKFLKKFRIIRPFILYSGATDERKNIPRLILAYAALPSHLRKSHQLVLAGGLSQDHLIELQSIAKTAGIRQGELIFTNFVTDTELVCLYKICKLYVFPSWYEGFGLPVLEAMKCGAPVIGANSTSLPEVIGLDEAMFNPFDVSAISSKMQKALIDESFRTRLRDNGIQRAQLFSWDLSATRAIKTWETISTLRSRSLTNTRLTAKKLYKAIAPHIAHQTDKYLLRISACLALNQSQNNDRQLLVDISELVKCDAKSGIQRVVRSILKEWVTNPPKGYKVEPVYATLHSGYYYARQFTANFMNLRKQEHTDEPIDYAPGDIFFGLDWQPQVQVSQDGFYQHLRRHGVKVFFAVYDLLCIQMPEHFVAGSKGAFTRWLETVSAVDGAFCISKAVADELNDWLTKYKPARLSSFDTHWFHLGADIDNSKPSLGLPNGAQILLAHFQAVPSFLIVGTLEPRKAHAQVLDAFELLWKSELPINFIIVGKKGWLVDELVQRLGNHCELNKRLFWLDGISDEYLKKIYVASTCLIAASYGEGFGLPLIEAAQHKLPIMARDIPVFREVAGEHAFYFDAVKPSELAQSIRSWLDLKNLDKHPKSENMSWLSWKESAAGLLLAMNLSTTFDATRNKLEPFTQI
jgi:glycosyltransferase involved in cell wall biosynthesis